jgi:hypothetical protein
MNQLLTLTEAKPVAALSSGLTLYPDSDRNPDLVPRLLIGESLFAYPVTS